MVIIKTFNKLLSIWLAVSIALANTYGYGYPTLFKSSSHAQRHLQTDAPIGIVNLTDSPSSISLPQSMGRIIESHKGKADSLVIHIQDRHADPVVQLNIANILDELVTGYKAELLCLEGASKELDTSFYDEFPDNDIKKRVAGFFVQKGLFTGAEYYKITHQDRYLKAQGVEDRQAYLEHMACYKANGIDKDSILRLIRAVRISLDSLKEQAYSKELKSVDRAAESYGLKGIELPEYLKTLETYSKKARLDISKYKNLDKFIGLIDKEKSIDFKKAEAQREALIKSLTENLKESALNTLITNSLHFKLGKMTQEEFYDYLYAAAEREGLNPSPYKDLTAYVDYIRFSKEIDHLAVFDEAEDLTQELRLALSRTPFQSSLVKYSKAANILEGLYSLKLTRRQLDYMENNAASFNLSAMQSFLKMTCPKYGLNLNPVIASARIEEQDTASSRRYYQLALKRDIALVDNTLKSMERSRKKRAVLITGGFHTQGITGMLRDREISYVVICPNIGPQDYDELYSDRMAGKLPGITELAEFFNHTLAAPLITADMGNAEMAGKIKELFAALCESGELPQKDIADKLARIMGAPEAEEGEVVVVKANSAGEANEEKIRGEALTIIDTLINKSIERDKKITGIILEALALNSGELTRMSPVKVRLFEAEDEAGVVQKGVMIDTTAEPASMYELMLYPSFVVIYDGDLSSGTFSIKKVYVQIHTYQEDQYRRIDNRMPGPHNETINLILVMLDAWLRYEIPEMEWSTDMPNFGFSYDRYEVEKNVRNKNIDVAVIKHLFSMAEIEEINIGIDTFLLHNEKEKPGAFIILRTKTPAQCPVGVSLFRKEKDGIHVNVQAGLREDRASFVHETAHHIYETMKRQNPEKAKKIIELLINKFPNYKKLPGPDAEHELFAYVIQAVANKSLIIEHIGDRITPDITGQLAVFGVLPQSFAPAKSASAGSVEEALSEAAASLNKRPHPLLGTSDPGQNLRDKVESLERGLKLSEQDERRLRSLIRRYFELERMVHRIKRDYISDGRIRLLSAANWTIFSHSRLQRALQPVIWSNIATDEESEYDFLSMYGIGAGLETAADVFFGSNEAVSLNLEGFSQLDGRPGSDLQHTGIAVVYSKELEKAIEMMAVDAPDEDYLLMGFGDYLSPEQEERLKKEVLTPDGIRDLREEMIVRRGIKTDTLPFLEIVQGPFDEREVMAADGIPSAYIEAIVVDDDIYNRFISINKSLTGKVVRASEYFSADNERLNELTKTMREIVEIIQPAEEKTQAGKRPIPEAEQRKTSSAGEPSGPSFAGYLAGIHREFAMGELDNAVLLADELFNSLSRKIGRGDLSNKEALKLYHALNDDIPDMVLKGCAETMARLDNYFYLFMPKDGMGEAIKEKDRYQSELQGEIDDIIEKLKGLLGKSGGQITREIQLLLNRLHLLHVLSWLSNNPPLVAARVEFLKPGADIDQAYHMMLKEQFVSTALKIIIDSAKEKTDSLFEEIRKKAGDALRDSAEEAIEDVEDPILKLTPEYFVHPFKRAWRECPDIPMPENRQGWKLHVAATEKDAGAILGLVLPILQRHNAAHKVINGIDMLKKLNAGDDPDLGDTQVGKFIAIYTESRQKAEILAKEIDLVLRDKGFAIPPRLTWDEEGSRGDKLIKGGRSGLVGYRYGSYHDWEIILPNGEKDLDVRDRYKHPAIAETMKNINEIRGSEEAQGESEFSKIIDRLIDSSASDSLRHNLKQALSKFSNVFESHPEFFERIVSMYFDREFVFNYEQEIVQQEVDNGITKSRIDEIMQGFILRYFLVTMAIEKGDRSGLDPKDILKFRRYFYRIYGNFNNEPFSNQQISPNDILTGEENRNIARPDDMVILRAFKHFAPDRNDWRVFVVAAYKGKKFVFYRSVSHRLWRRVEAVEPGRILKPVAENVLDLSADLSSRLDSLLDESAIEPLELKIDYDSLSEELMKEGGLGVEELIAAGEHSRYDRFNFAGRDMSHPGRVDTEKADKWFAENLDRLRGSKTSSAGQAVDAAIGLGKTYTELLNNIHQRPNDRYFGISPNRYGLIIYDRMLRGAEEEKNILKALAALQTARGLKFEIVVTTAEDRENLIKQWGIGAENVRTAEQFLQHYYQRTDISEQFPDEQDKVTAAADILRRQMPVGIVAAPGVDIEAMARNINASKKHNDKYVFITSQEPSDVVVDGQMKSSFVISEVSIIDILNKLRDYDKIIEGFGKGSLEENVSKLIAILPPITDHNEFIKEIERLRLATEAIKESA